MGELSGHLENQPTAAVAAEPWLEHLRDRVISPPRSHLDKRWQLFNLWNDYLMNTFIAAVSALFLARRYAPILKSSVAGQMQRKQG